MFIKKQDSERTFDPPPPHNPFQVQELQTEKPALGRDPWLNHLEYLHSSISQGDSKLLARHPQCPIVSELPGKNFSAMFVPQPPVIAYSHF